MSLLTSIERLRYVDCLIRRKATGDLKKFSQKLNLSKSQACEFIKQMKQVGFPIKYCRRRNSYYYNEEGRLVKDFFERDISVEDRKGSDLSASEMKKISGGRGLRKKLFHSDYIGMSNSNFVL